MSLWLHYICTESKLGTKLIRSPRPLQLGQGRGLYKGGGGGYAAPTADVDRLSRPGLLLVFPQLLPSLAEAVPEGLVDGS